jgi:hypothetical protein
MDRGQEIRELKLGASFTNPNARTNFHTLKCELSNFHMEGSKILPHFIIHFSSPSFISAFHDVTDDFKPASVDAHKEATLETGTNNQVTVTVPHLGKFCSLLDVYLIPRPGRFEEFLARNFLVCSVKFQI